MRRGHEVARDIAIRALLPARTETYSPIHHSDFINLLANKISDNRMEITDSKYYTNMTGTKLVGYYSVRAINSIPNDLGVEMMVGFKNSYDKSMTAALVAGANVSICSNGLVFGDLMSFVRKHTGNVRDELLLKMDEAIGSLESGFNRLMVQIDIMKDYELTPKQRAEILGVMYFENNILTPNQLSIVKREITQSEHFNGNTIWDLYNNVTEALKTSHVLTHIEDHIKLHDFMTTIAEAKMIEEIEILEEIADGENTGESTTG